MNQADVPALEKSVRDLIVGLLTPDPSIIVPVPVPACEVIWEAENGVQPLNSYMTLNLIVTSVMIGNDDYMEHSQGVDKERYFNGQRTCTLSINGYGKTATDLLFALKNRFEIEKATELCSSLGLAIIEHGDILDLTELQDTKFQNRGQMDVQLSYTVRTLSGSGNTARIEIEDQILDEEFIVEP